MNRQQCLTIVMLRGSRRGAEERQRITRRHLAPSEELVCINSTIIHVLC